MPRIYRVVTEREGETRKEDGGTITDIQRSEYRYAAESLEQVWDAIVQLRHDPEEEVIAIHQEHPAVIILSEETNPAFDFSDQQSYAIHKGDVPRD